MVFDLDDFNESFNIILGSFLIFYINRFNENSIFRGYGITTR